MKDHTGEHVYIIKRGDFYCIGKLQFAPQKDWLNFYLSRQKVGGMWKGMGF